MSKLLKVLSLVLILFVIALTVGCDPSLSLGFLKLESITPNDGKTVALKFSKDVGRFTDSKIRFYTGTTESDAINPVTRTLVERDPVSLIFADDTLYLTLKTTLVKDQYLTVVLEKAAVESSTFDMFTEYTTKTAIIQSLAPKFLHMYIYPANPVKYMVIYDEILAAKDLTKISVLKNSADITATLTIEAATSESIVGYVQNTNYNNRYINYGFVITFPTTAPPAAGDIININVLAGAVKDVSADQHENILLDPPREVRPGHTYRVP